MYFLLKFNASFAFVTFTNPCAAMIAFSFASASFRAFYVTKRLCASLTTRPIPVSFFSALSPLTRSISSSS